MKLLRDNIQLLVVLVIAVFLYVYRLSSIPFAVHGDEGETAMQAIEIVRSHLNIFGLGWYDLPIISFIPHNLTMLVFGQSNFGNRIASVIFSLLSLVFFYMLAKNLFSKRVALIATIFLTTSHMWIGLSRIGVSYTQAAFCSLGLFYFAYIGLKKRSYLFFLPAGIFFALCFYTYYAARIAPFVIGAILILNFLSFKKIKRHILQIIILVTTAVIAISPQLSSFINNPGSFSSRARGVFIFSQENKEEYIGKNSVEIILEQISKTFNIFAGDNSGQYGLRGQLLDYLTLFLFLVGIFFLIKNLKLSSFFLFLWLSSTIVAGQILTASPTPIFLPRFVVGLPALYLICALGVEVIYKSTNKFFTKGYLLIGAIVICIIAINLKIYFMDYQAQLEKGETAAGVTAATPTRIGYYTNELPNAYKVFYEKGQLIDGGHGTVRFLAPNIKAHMYSPPNEIAAKSFFAEINQVSKVDNKSAFIFYPSNIKTVDFLKELYPSGSFNIFYNSNGSIEFYSYVISE